MRYAARKDNNHNDIVKHLKAAGWSVLDLSRLGGGCPDVAVARRGFTALVEIKSSGKAKLTPAQVMFWVAWPGVRIKAISPQDAEKQLNLAESYFWLRTRGYAEPSA